LRSEAHFAYFLLNLSFPAFSFSFGFKAGIVSHYTCLLEMIVSLEVEL
jgi:hypothetical protein